jgi:hypothetical protein
MTVRKALLKDNFIIVENFISKENAVGLYKHLKDEYIAHPELFGVDAQCPKSISIYNYRWFLELLIYKISFMADIMEEPMFPTYSFARIYKNGEVLTKHTDRPACEISVTMHLDSDGTPWPINFTKPDGEVVSIELKPGQAAIYLGEISEHWRDEFKGQEYGQVFLHYVRGRGCNWEHYFDRLRK